MYLEVSAMALLELHRTLEADRRREMREALRRGALLESLAAAETASGEVAGVALGDRAGRGRDQAADVGRVEDLNPTSRGEQVARRVVRPVQSQPEA
jgi:hypothetical protein